MQITDAVRCSIELDAALARVYSTVEERPWGLLFHNAANPDHYDSNLARQIRASDPEATIAEITGFYHERGLIPRVKTNNLTAPRDFAARLQAHGWQFEHTLMRVMTWEGSALAVPPLPPGVMVVRAGLADLEDVARVQADGFGAGETSWIVGFLVAELANPTSRYYLARVDGQAASALSVFKTPTVGVVSNVATRPAYRGRGLASLLLAQAQAEARVPLLLEVTEDNAERLYRRAGFAVRGELDQRICWLSRRQIQETTYDDE